MGIHQKVEPVFDEADRGAACPYFTIRLGALFVGSVFSMTGIGMLISSLVVETLSGFTSAARAQGIDTFTLSLFLLFPPLLLFLIEFAYNISYEKGVNDPGFELPPMFGTKG